MSDRVVAVILAKDAIERVPLVVAAVQAQTVVPTGIVVVDNGSTDGTTDWLRAHSDLHLVHLEDNLGVGAGHNHGWEAARALEPELTFIWSLEHDSIPDAQCLERLMTTFAASQTAGARMGAVVPTQALPEERRLDHARPPFRHRMLTFNGTLFSIAALAAVGPIREDFFVGHEDREFALRLTAAGFVIVKDPDARVVHENKHARRRGRPNVLRSYYSNRNEAYLIVHVRHDRFGRLRVLGRTIGGVGRALLRERQKRARLRARVRATVDGLRGDLGKKQYPFLEPSP